MLILHIFFVVYLAKCQTFKDFWEKTDTKWEFVSKHKFGGAMNVGTQFVSVGNIWYLFYREYYSEKYPGCETRDNAKVVVVMSKDKGNTYTNKTDVGIPDRENVYTQCAVVDGGGYFDKETNKWHYLSQCLGTQQWCLCHYFREGSSPIGPWTPNKANPVVKGGDLFKKICGGSAKHCSPNTVDEGTPEIVEKVNGEFFITFHGYDYQKKVSARGVAATTDFVHYRVDGSLLPNDAIFTSLDCNKWNIDWDNSTKCIGGGEGTTIIENEYKYMLIEAPDLELGCITKPGVQNWVLGLMRSKTWAKTGEWEEFSVNPTVVPYRKKGCAIQYHRLFKSQDDGKIYLSYWIFGDTDYWMKIFRLTSGSGDLPIVAKV